MEQLLPAGSFDFGQIAVRDRYVLSHIDDVDLAQAEIFRAAEDAIALAKFDDDQKYRPLKTAANLRHGWRMELVDLGEVVRALDYFYPARLSILRAFRENRLTTTPLRATLDRQSGMYRVASSITDDKIDNVVAEVCQPCVRRILWRRNASGEIPSTKLPTEKYEVANERLPLLCQEACTILINACRKAVKAE